jgi:hypothetical protein
MTIDYPTSDRAPSKFRVEKARIDAVITLSNGDSTQGHFFVARGSAHCSGPERVGELLNAEPGFFPFELRGPRGNRTVLYNRRQVVTVALAENEASRVPGHDVATERLVSVLLSNGDRVAGAVRVHRPEGRDRLSDWTREPDIFRYIETGATAMLVNIAHVIEVSEVSKP